MKLFSKNDIQKKKTDERAREVAQGVALATRVNELRQTASMEEVRTKAFREESIALTDEQIAAKVAEKNDVEVQLEDAKEALAEALKPLDDKWEEVNASADANTAEATALAEIRASLEEREAAVTAAENDSVVEQQRLTVLHDTTQKNLVDSDAIRKEAEVLRDENVAHVQVQTSSLEQREALVATREQNADSREKAHATRDAELDERERFLNEEERRIRDLDQTFTRTKNRNNGN